jgi:nitrous oxidase accessory protein NosD
MLDKLVKCAVMAAFAMTLSGASRSASAGPPELVVPSDYPTIQSAIDAAKPGRTIRVLPGTYAEQLTFTKNLTIVGAGMDVTIIRAPATLVPGPLGSPAIVEAYGGARVSISGLTIRGPGAAACGQEGVLRWGVRVHSRAHLDVAFAAVRDIQNTPMEMCPRSGTAIAVGQSAPGSPPASLSIHHSEVTGYQSVGIIVLGAGSWANISHNTVAGPGHAGGVPTNGIEVVAGAAGTVVHNTVSGNICPEGMPDVCGPDFFNQFQEAGIAAGGNGPGTIISHNLLVGNQMGMFLSEVDEISQNVMVDNEYYGLGLVGVDSGSFTVDGGEIRGGAGGIWVTAVLVDMTVVLNQVTFSGLSGPAVDILEDGGFMATVIGGP